ncbi:MAG TPA: YciK family oxidoreductase [Alcanivoracaceae bacterium]|nr:YciK family oxidoreductase [Alcanivoracaceae bacterium]
MDLAAISAAAQAYECPDNALQGKVILVTGAGDGIGRAAALTFAEHGATVILLGRTPEKLERVYDEIERRGGPQPAIVPMNLAVVTPDQCLELSNMLGAAFPQLDGILHNASSLGNITPIENYDEGTWDTVMQVNVNAGFYLTRALMPMLRASNDARIVFTSSSVGRKGRAFWGAYAVSKFATEGLMQVLADELENTGNITVHSINPGGTRTDMRAQAYPGEDPLTRKTPEEIMPAYLYLFGPEGAKHTGLAIDAQ